MKIFNFFNDYQFIIFPVFYTAKDSDNNEFVFLKTEEEEISFLNSVTDKTQLEAYENHVHIFGKVKKKYQHDFFEISKLITDNLIKQLELNFPNKKFHVYLDCDFTDHIIIRFHQHWCDEHPYYNVKEFSTIKEYLVGF